MTEWATPSDVLSIAKATVTEDDVTSARFIVELFAHTTTEASDAGNISSGNLRLLRMAVAYQAAWMQAHPDVLTNVDVDSFSQDGQSAVHAHANAALLAPLAKRCIDRLSWRRESIRTTTRRRPGDRDSAAADDNQPWRPMHNGAVIG
ncbi:hypothetical protein [Rhizomonospora bruguierae]|uniref:hypothetical protein n=1 Tax=Rhizomonospora bruguierae TaxID=1581705 RepID=UPI001BCC829E|nr:hypothetical protein [Micromonospora sp. NBRC 107566]